MIRKHLHPLIDKCDYCGSWARHWVFDHKSGKDIIYCDWHHWWLERCWLAPLFTRQIQGGFGGDE